MSTHVQELNAQELSVDYFAQKKGQDRRSVADLSQLSMTALEIAHKVLRLCYPVAGLKAVHCYYNNENIKPFMLPQYNFSDDVKKDSVIRDYTVIDIYFFIEGVYETESEQTAFVVEVAYPKSPKRARWNIARVRWADLGWQLRGNYELDSPLPELIGQTYVNNWH